MISPQELGDLSHYVLGRHKTTQGKGCHAVTSRDLAISEALRPTPASSFVGSCGMEGKLRYVAAEVDLLQPEILAGHSAGEALKP